MIYAASISTDKGTTEANAVRTVLKVTAGLIWRIEVEFPPGCCGLAHCQIFDGKYQMFPASPEETFHSDGVLIGLDDLYLKTSGPFEFIIKTWNLDETWPHEIQVRVCMASAEAFMSRYMPSLTWEKMNETLTQALADQDKIKAAQLTQIQSDLEDI